LNRLDRPKARLLVAAAAVAVLSTGCAGNSPPVAAPADRQAEVAERGASVMPFDLERTTHHFTKTDTGGVQTVVADDPQDTAQITLIREHLTAEADRFRRGDFTDPARIHGKEMPGLAALRAHDGRIAIEYQNTTDGARATYTTTDAELRDALHAWFDAQVSDHGSHATS
jgi:hypothetical protein